MPTVASEPQRPRTKAERSAATRARLLDATIDCLVELGWSGTSTTEVVRRAGVSRGAQVHHYHTKEDLVIAAVEHLCTRRMDEYRAAIERLPAHERTPAASIDLLWSVWSGPTLEAWLELVIAGRTQPALRDRFAEFERRFFDAAVALFQETQPEMAVDPAFARLALRFTFCLLDGLAVARLVGTERTELDRVIEGFKLLTTIVPSLDLGALP
ncbi:MAG: TetR/AcrR family transcriptional regulator [Acidimicrobiales bacterium]